MPTLLKPKAKSFSSSELKGEAVVSTKNMSLPTAPSQGVTRVEQAKFLVVAPPGWGKSEFCMSNPNSILLACEEGHKFIEGYKLIIDAWDGCEPFVDADGIQHCSFVAAVAILQKERKRFNMVIIDTVDMLVKMLLDFTLGKKRVEHASDLGDYGKGFDIAQNTPFRKEFNKLIKTGRGVMAVTHEQVESRTFQKGPMSKKETTLPAGIYKQLFAQFDLIVHGVFGKMRKGEKTRDRLLISEGSENLLAKNRGGYLPPGFVVPKDIKKRWPLFASFFTDPKAREAAYQEFLKAGYDLE